MMMSTRPNKVNGQYRPDLMDQRHAGTEPVSRRAKPGIDTLMSETMCLSSRRTVSWRPWWSRWDKLLTDQNSPWSGCMLFAR